MSDEQEDDGSELPAWDEEPEPVDASHLLRVRCTRTGCVTLTLAAPEAVRVALCTEHLGQGVTAPELAGRYTPAVGYPVPFGAVARVREPGVVPIPPLVAPELVCSSGCGHEVPKPVAQLAVQAHLDGWQVEHRHSRGQVVGGTGKQLAVAEMWSVRFRRGSWAGYAVRRGGAWDSVCVTGADLPPFLHLGVTGLKEWLEQPERGERWYADVVEREAAQKLAAKIVKCPGPGECIWVDERRGEHTHRGNGDIKIKTSRSEKRHGN